MYGLSVTHRINFFQMRPDLEMAQYVKKKWASKLQGEKSLGLLRNLRLSTLFIQYKLFEAEFQTI